MLSFYAHDGSAVINTKINRDKIIVFTEHHSWPTLLRKKSRLNCKRLPSHTGQEQACPLQPTTHHIPYKGKYTSMYIHLFTVQTVFCTEAPWSCFTIIQHWVINKFLEIAQNVFPCIYNLSFTPHATQMTTNYPKWPQINTPIVHTHTYCNSSHVMLSSSPIFCNKKKSNLGDKFLKHFVVHLLWQGWVA